MINLETENNALALLRCLIIDKQARAIIAIGDLVRMDDNK